MKFPRATRQVEAQDPHPQRLVVPGQHRPSEVVKAGRTRLAPTALAVRPRVVASVPNNRGTITGGTANALWPAMLTHQREALGVVHQPGEVTKSDAGIMAKAPRALQPPHQMPASSTTQITTLESDKSHGGWSNRRRWARLAPRRL